METYLSLKTNRVKEKEIENDILKLKRNFGKGYRKLKNKQELKYLKKKMDFILEAISELS